MDARFLEAVYDDSINYPNFFNGRILTATDLRDGQTAALKRARYLGQASGDGVVYGLNVKRTSSGSALEVGGGLAVNRRGDPLYLPGEKMTLELIISETPLPLAGSPFMACDVSSATTVTGLVATGYYVLALTAVTRLSTAQAAHSGLNGEQACTSRYEQAAVQFKVIPLTLADFEPYTAAELRPLNRSHLAHRCFGTYELMATARDPLGTAVSYGLLDELQVDERLTDCDVPLAVFHFQNEVVRFVDVWPVRRPCLPGMRGDPNGSAAISARSTWLADPFGAFTGARRALEAQALLLQFQNQLDELIASASEPTAIRAADHFAFLPAAGYLPVAFALPGVIPSTFFGRSIPEQDLDPALLRSIFHESFYEAPLHPADDVDLFALTDRSAGDARYVIFTRSHPLPVFGWEEAPVSVEEEEQTPPASPVPSTGDLGVVVLSPGGDPISAGVISSVQATAHEGRGQVYPGTRKSLATTVGSGFRARQAERFLRKLSEETGDKYAAIYAEGGGEVAIDDVLLADPEAIPVYFFEDLPAGEYTVKAEATSNAYYGVPEQLTVRANVSNYGSVVLRRARTEKPGDRGVYIPDEKLLPDGLLLDGYIFDPGWVELIPKWETEVPGIDRGDIDPVPWVEVGDPALALAIERILGSEPGLDPRVAAANPEIYVMRGIDPVAAVETVNAFVQTQDGSRLPLVVIPADNALDKDVPVDRTGLRDYDRATVTQLAAAGLGRLDAVASAPLPLVAAAIGQSAAYTDSLIGETRTMLQDDFRNGYMSYPGIGKEESDALKAQFSDRVDLANASSERVLGILGGVSAGFAERFLVDVRSGLDPGSYTLGGTTISGSGQDALAEELGVVSNEGFREMAADAEGRNRLKETLGVDDATLDGYVQEATLAYARGQFQATPEKSIVTLENMTAEVAADLAAAGYGSAKTLVYADEGAVATAAGVSAEEARAIVGEAVEYGGNAYLTVVAGASGGEITRELLGGAGYFGPGAILGADTSELALVGNIGEETAGNVKNMLTRFLGSGGLSGSMP